MNQSIIRRRFFAARSFKKRNGIAGQRAPLIAAIPAIFLMLQGMSLQAQTEDLQQTHIFAESRIDNSQETRLFPARVAVPGMLWGTTPGYRDGMVHLKISCGVDDTRISENAEGDEAESYVALFRVELYRYNDGDWEYVDWYRLPGTPPVSACKSLRAAAGLATADRPLHVRLKIRARGTQHRNLVEDWSFAGEVER
ncbi:MAG: hypothetical protein NXI24_17885 [bacterium]|nr:hypothetical protein [bacterium]